MKKYLIIILCFVCSYSITGNLSAQDLTFSQFYEQPLLRNPALAGIFPGDYRVAASFRSQWASVTVPYRTTSLSAEFKLPTTQNNDVYTLGAQINVDEAGDIRLRRTQFFPAICFHKSLDRDRDTYLSVAFMGGPVSSHFDQTQAILGDQYQNGNYSPGNPTAQTLTVANYSYWDISAGLAFSSALNEVTNFYAGAAIAHFNNAFLKSATASTSAFSIPTKYTFNIGISYTINDNSKLIGFSDYFVQAGSKQFFLGALYGINIYKYNNSEPYSISAGAFLRWNDAFIPVIKMDMLEFSAGLSYDINVSKLTTASGYLGGFEVTLVYKNLLKNRSLSLRNTRCPKF